MTISLELKKKCVEASANGMSSTQIYNEIFMPEHDTMAYHTFRRRLQDWKKASGVTYADDFTLRSGTYEGFTAHRVTVQVDGKGNVTQAWVKQSADEVNWDLLIEKFTDRIAPYEVQYDEKTSEIYPMRMLEIPLFDMHFGVATLQDYENILAEIIDIITSKKWNEINILFGQDVLHTNDMRGHTAKGTDIGVIDFTSAWNDCFAFFSSVLMSALEHCENVKMHYSRGNHDECSAWCMFKCLEAKFPQITFDDTILPRKCIVWQKCFIGYGHCEYKNNKSGLFRDFVVDFPTEYAQSSVREIHCGHLHSESMDDGMMIRRLASAVPCDEWSKNNGYIASHKRFQLFEWMPEKLKSIIYIGG